MRRQNLYLENEFLKMKLYLLGNNQKGPELWTILHYWKRNNNGTRNRSGE